MKISSEQISKIGKLFTIQALNYSEYLTNLINFDNGIRFVGNVKLDKIGSDTIMLYWDICSNYVIIALRKIDIGFNPKTIGKYTIGAKFPEELHKEYIQYKSDFDLFIQIVEDIIKSKLEINKISAANCR